jgi:DNA helicase-2/ATP-dependent DNA helicase PcrA
MINSSSQPRHHQQAVLTYQSGRMGVAAVPGSGKTWTLSRLAADIITSGKLLEKQEVLVVTLVNSAVDNFNQRVSEFLKESGLLPRLGYRVRTLHGLANDIVRERPDLAGLSDTFQIIDESEANRIRSQVAQIWLRNHPHDLDDYLNTDLEENRLEWVQRERLPDLVENIALAYIRFAKDRQLTPQRLRTQLDQLPVPLPLAEMGWELYHAYQRALAYRDAVDFDDLIRLALENLQQDEDLLARLQKRWPYIFEDEAQDSSRLQEQILETLAGSTGNWVRVGDPNQAIFETFTTASPAYLRRFIKRPDVTSRELPESGRSTEDIIALANYLIDWTAASHPIAAVRDALDTPHITPVSSDAESANPDPADGKIQLVNHKYSPAGEINAVVESIAHWLPENTERTVVVLVPRNSRASQVISALQQRDIPCHDGLLRASASTRQTAGALGNLLNYLADPGSGRKLATAYRVWRREERDDTQSGELIAQVAKHLKDCPRVEDYLYPRSDRDWLADKQFVSDEPELKQLLEFRALVRRWQAAILLPIDQIILTLAQDIFSEPTDLALSHKLASLLRQASNNHQDWHFPELTDELAVIARNERRFLGFSEDDSGFDPDQHKGKVVVATFHKAKGLEWDRVYLMSANNYNFPSGQTGDRYIAENWFIRDSLNLQSETLSQLEAAFSASEYDWYQERKASQQARLDYVRERLRLLYVGITRARQDLIITWNSGRKGDLQPALPFLALLSYFEEELDSAKDESTDQTEMT